MNAVGVVRQLIIDDAATVALLSSGAAVYPVVVPQTVSYPAITLRIGDDEPETYKWTPTAEKDRVTLVVGIWSKEYTTAQQIDEALRAAIDAFVGDVTTDDNVTHTVHEIAFIRRKDGYDKDNLLFYREVIYRVILMR
jgi:hypothetical protein